ncbi:S8 family serine peptidase [bacterium]|nr:S8 family serine peptidase [bacterium]
MKSVFLRTALVVALAFMLWPIGIARGAETTPQWVYFRDKGTATVNLVKALDQAEEELSPRCRARREKSMSVLADEFDLPVHREYVQSVRQTGAKVSTVSKWLNAVSIEATANQIEAIEHLSFVGRVEPFRLRRTDRFEPSPCPASRLDDPDYGPSFRQNEICRIPELHARGLSGRGVLICFLDTGFLLTHRAFDSLNVAATRDFIFGDSVVHDEVGQDSAGQHGHGTVVLSAAAGYRDGSLIGPAYSADVLLAKTEWTASETAVEEDYFVAALEWADSLGTDIVSSSLGYHDWYTFEDMDGQTAVTTQAVNVAVSRGILVVTAAGNSRDNDWGHIIAPADADSILATGAVDTMLAITWFSSPGPTADGRIKPDVCALGEYVYSADPATTDGYFWVGGTSLSTPLVPTSVKRLTVCC